MLSEKKPDMKDHTLYVSIYRNLLFIRKCLEKEIFYRDSRFLFTGSRKWGWAKEFFEETEIWNSASLCKTVNLFKTTEYSKWVKFIVCKLYINNV